MDGAGEAFKVQYGQASCHAMPAMLGNPTDDDTRISKPNQRPSFLALLHTGGRLQAQEPRRAHPGRGRLLRRGLSPRLLLLLLLRPPLAPAAPHAIGVGAGEGALGVERAVA